MLGTFPMKMNQIHKEIHNCTFKNHRPSITYTMPEEFDGTKGVIRIRKSKTDICCTCTMKVYEYILASSIQTTISWYLLPVERTAINGSSIAQAMTGGAIQNDWNDAYFCNFL